MEKAKGAFAKPVLNRKRWTSVLAAILIGAAIMTGCSSGGSNTADNKGLNGGLDRSVSTESSVSVGMADEAAAAEDKSAVAEAPSEGSVGGTGISADSAGIAQGKIIYTANLTMEVEELKAASSKLRDAIHLSGGYILEFNDTRYDGEIGATYNIKVPAAGFMSFIDAVSKIENLHFGQSLSGKDVTEQYVDLEARLKAKQLVERRLTGMMEKAVKADELLQFSNQLGVVQEEIETIKGKIRYLDNNVAFSTVSLRIVQRDQSLPETEDGEERSFGERLSDTVSGSFDVVVEGVKLLIIVLAGALPVIAVLAVIFVPVWMLVRYRRNRKRGQLHAAVRQPVISEPEEPESDV